VAKQTDRRPSGARRGREDGKMIRKYRKKPVVIEAAY
jgi:hypothetical protein